MSNVKEFKLGELFCGPGGLALGAISARIEDPEYRIVHKWANDYDASTCDTYRRNICPLLQKCEDLLLGARVRYSAHGKGHEEGGSTYARRDRASGVPLEILEHLPP